MFSCTVTAVLAHFTYSLSSSYLHVGFLPQLGKSDRNECMQHRLPELSAQELSAVLVQMQSWINNSKLGYCPANIVSGIRIPWWRSNCRLYLTLPPYRYTIVIEQAACRID
jgi:hypothetical protein